MSPAPPPNKALFGPIPLRAIADQRLSRIELRVLAAVASFDRLSMLRGDSGGCWAGNLAISKLCNCRRDSVSHSISMLEIYGYLRRRRVPGSNARHLQVIYETPSPITLGTLPNTIGEANPQVIASKGESSSEYTSKENVEKQIRKRKSPAKLRHLDLQESLSLEGIEGTLCLMESGLREGGTLDDTSRHVVGDIFASCEPGSPLYERARRILEGSRGEG